MAEVEQPTTASVEEKKTPPTAAKQEQPTKKKKIFGEIKKPDTIIYRLIKENDVKMREDTPRYPPYIRFPNYDIITWEDGTRAIRWLPGEQSIFVDEQEKEGRRIPDNIINNPNNRFEVINGDIRVQPHQKTKIQFLDMCNRNADSKYRTGSVPILFRRYSEEAKTEQLSDKQKKQQEAIRKAFSADEPQVAFHADYLGIPLIDGQTNATRTFESVVTDYRQVAVDDPVRFLKTFDDEDLKLKYKIKMAIESNVISLNFMPGKAVWVGSKEEISDVPETKELKQVVDTLFLFSQTGKGTPFLKRIADFEG